MADADLKPGRWRCLLCAAPVWRIGSLQDYAAHYYREHQQEA